MGGDPGGSEAKKAEAIMERSSSEQIPMAEQRESMAFDCGEETSSPSPAIQVETEKVSRSSTVSSSDSPMMMGNAPGEKPKEEKEMAVNEGPDLSMMMMMEGAGVANSSREHLSDRRDA